MQYTYAFEQGSLDSICGVYALVNAEKIVNGSTDKQSQELFNEIITYLSKKHILRETLIEGIGHRRFSNIVEKILGERIPIRITNVKGIERLGDFWKMGVNWLSKPNRAIIISMGGREDHYTTAWAMSDRAIQVADSGGIKVIRRSACRLRGYTGTDRYVLFPSQCIFLGKADEPE